MRVLRSAVVTSLLLAAGTAHADVRSFTHAYEYTTNPEGKTAIEMWHTQTRSSSNGTAPHVYEGILEIEHGITEHWDMSFYTVLEQSSVADNPLHLSRAKLDTRYRFSERGEWPIDTVAYAELGKQFGESIYTGHIRAIGARDFGDVTVAANAYAEASVGNDAENTEPAFGWAVGATYQAHNKLKLGAESWGAVSGGDVYASLGPVLTFSPSSSFWTTVTVGFGLTDNTQAAEHGYLSARAIIGIQL